MDTVKCFNCNRMGQPGNQIQQLCIHCEKARLMELRIDQLLEMGMITGDAVIFLKYGRYSEPIDNTPGELCENCGNTIEMNQIVKLPCCSKSVCWEECIEFDIMENKKCPLCSHKLHIQLPDDTVENSMVIIDIDSGRISDITDPMY